MSSQGKTIGIAIVAIIIGIGIFYGIGGSNDEINESTTTDSTMQETSGLSGIVDIGLILPLSG